MKLYSSCQRGVTLIELVISIVIISIAMVAVLNSFSVSMTHSSDPLWRNKTLKLAQLYLDEILAKNYDHNTPVGGLPEVSNPSCASLGPDAGEDRTNYNDVDDYHGTADSPPVSIIGSLDASYANYSVSVTVVCDGTNVGAGGVPANNQAKLITVQVTPPGESAVAFAVYKGNF